MHNCLAQEISVKQSISHAGHDEEGNGYLKVGQFITFLSLLQGSNGFLLVVVVVVVVAVI